MQPFDLQGCTGPYLKDRNFLFLNFEGLEVWQYFKICYGLSLQGTLQRIKGSYQTSLTKLKSKNQYFLIITCLELSEKGLG